MCILVAAAKCFPACSDAGIASARCSACLTAMPTLPACWSDGEHVWGALVVTFLHLHSRGAAGGRRGSLCYARDLTGDCNGDGARQIFGCCSSKYAKIAWYFRIPVLFDGVNLSPEPQATDATWGFEGKPFWRPFLSLHVSGVMKSYVEVEISCRSYLAKTVTKLDQIWISRFVRVTAEGAEQALRSCNITRRHYTLRSNVTDGAWNAHSAILARK